VFAGAYGGEVGEAADGAVDLHGGAFGGAFDAPLDRLGAPPLVKGFFHQARRDQGGFRGEGAGEAEFGAVVVEEVDAQYGRGPYLGGGVHGDDQNGITLMFRQKRLAGVRRCVVEANGAVGANQGDALGAKGAGHRFDGGFGGFRVRTGAFGGNVEDPS